MKQIILSILLCMVLVASGKAQAVSLTKENWLSHPEIVATIDVYKEIRASIDDKTLRHYQRTVAAMGEYVYFPAESLAEDSASIEPLTIQ